jgi:hypothetical protein
MRLVLGMWNYFHNFFFLKVCQISATRQPRLNSGFLPAKGTPEATAAVWIDN